MKKCGLVIRVSTDRQARNTEGSLHNQRQRLHAHIEYKSATGDEKWIEARKYVLKAVSGRDSIRSPEFARLYEDVRSGAVNTVVCTALDRVSRSVKDFLSFFEFMNEHGVEFVCLKQNYDTTSPQGRLLITMMMALAEFEREQTSERTRDAALARAERGLWNGGQILGYELDPDRKGYLIPNEQESTLVNFAFRIYLACGSILETAKALNSKGYRTKEYTSRRGRHHPAREFSYSSVQVMLANRAYVGQKEINKKRRPRVCDSTDERDRYRVVDAVWEPIVDKAVFEEAQDLLRRNHESKHNEVRRPRHTYVLNGGLLWCGQCGAEMEGRSGTGRKGGRYYYYACKNGECGFRVSADEAEGVVLERLGQLARSGDVLEAIAHKVNQQLTANLPELERRRAALTREFHQTKDLATGLLDQMASLSGQESAKLAQERLEELGRRKRQIEEDLDRLELEIESYQGDSISSEKVRLTLECFGEVFERLRPHRRKDLIRLVLHKAILSPDCMKMALYGHPPEIGPSSVSVPELRSQTPTWLPGVVSQSVVLWDEVGLEVAPGAKGRSELSLVP